MKDQPIIDFHAHLGDIFKDARNVIYKLGLKPADMPDPFTVREERGFKGPFITEDTDEALREFIDVNHERCRTNTLENMQREMDECGIDYICVLPIMPALSFEDYEVAHMVEPRCIPFTCIDYRLGKDAGKKLLEDSEKGAYALKLHPILSKRALDDPLTEEALRYWAETGKPVTSHCGAGMYYYPEINDQYATPEFGDLAHLVECARRHPEINFVAAHCGGTAAGNIERLLLQVARGHRAYDRAARMRENHVRNRLSVRKLQASGRASDDSHGRRPQAAKPRLLRKRQPPSPYCVRGLERGEAHSEFPPLVIRIFIRV